MSDSAVGVIASRSWWEGVRRALRLRPARPSYALAASVLVPAATFAVIGAWFGVWDEVGVAYLAVACAAVFLAGSLRARLVTVLTQCSGACVGFGVGVLAGSSGLAAVAVPTGVALLAGAVGTVGPAMTAAALMAVIAVAYAQFGGSVLAWPQLCLWYSIGSAAMALPLLLALVLRGRGQDRVLIAAVFDRAADLLEVVGTASATSARAALAAASARCRESLQDHLIGRNLLLGDYADAVAAALQAAQRHATDVRVTADQIGGLRRRAETVRRTKTPPRTPATQFWTPIRVRFLGAVKTVVAPPARRTAIRLGVCIGAASALTVALHHNQSHSFWLLLTVAVVVRPEYGSVFRRTVNRVVGSVGGAVIASTALLFVNTGISVAIVAAASLAGGMLFSRYSYAFSVAGATTSALLSACIGQPDVLFAAIRLMDTVLGCVLALVLGYLVWPDQRTGTDRARELAAIAAARTYLNCIGKATPVPATVRDRAYRSAHDLVSYALAAADEPPPAGRRAAELLPQALRLDRLIDDISALAGQLDTTAADVIRAQLDRIEHPEPDEGPPGTSGSAAR